MITRETTWGDIWPYAYIQDKRGEVWKILEEKSGWLLLQNRAGQQASMERPADDVPVTSVEMEFEEAMAAIYRVFPGAQIIGQIPDPARR